MQPLSRFVLAGVLLLAGWTTLPHDLHAQPRAAKYEFDLETARTFWAFQPPKKSLPPAVKDTTWPTGALDRFLLAELEAKGLRPVADADPRTLLRRLSFDLIG